MHERIERVRVRTECVRIRACACPCARSRLCTFCGAYVRAHVRVRVYVSVCRSPDAATAVAVKAGSTLNLEFLQHLHERLFDALVGRRTTLSEVARLNELSRQLCSVFGAEWRV